MEVQNESHFATDFNGILQPVLFPYERTRRLLVQTQTCVYELNFCLHFTMQKFFFNLRLVYF